MKYRLVTRSDFDGLVCAALLKELDMIDDIKFVHPKDMQDGKIEITSNGGSQDVSVILTVPRTRQQFSLAYNLLEMIQSKFPLLFIFLNSLPAFRQ